MRSKRVSLVVFGCAAVLAVTGVVLMTTAPRSQSTEAEAGVTRALDYVRVPALRVVLRAVRDRIEVPGLIKPIRSVSLAAEVAGPVAAIGAAEHAPVQAGQTIVQLDDKLRQAALDRAKAAVARTRSTHRLAELDLERQRQLFEKGVSSQAEMDRAVSEERATLGALQEAEAALVEAEELLAKTTIRAPFDGILTSFDLEVGDRVEVGRTIGEVIDLDRVEIEVGVTDKEIVALTGGDPVTFEVGVYPGRLFEGRIRRVGSALDAAMHKFPVEIVADNPAGVLLPGMVCEVRAEIGDERPVLRIPRQATVEEFGLTYVFVLRRNDDHYVAERRRVAVRPVPFRPALLEVADGVVDGEIIVASNVRDVADGLPVTAQGVGDAP